VAVEDRLVVVVVVGAPEHELVLDPDQGLAELKALREQGAREGVGERAGRVEDVERRPRGERAVSGGERLGEQGLKARCTIAADPKPLGRLALVVDAVGRIGQQQLGRAIADPA
jgi:hypothetical protein